MGSQGGNGLPLGHRSASRHAGDDDALAHPGQGVLGPYRSSSPAEGGHTGGHIPGDAQLVQLVHLFLDGAVQTGVAGVEPDRGLAALLHVFDDGQYLLQGHLGAVINGGALPGHSQQSGIHQAARVDDAVGLAQQLSPPQGDKIGPAGAGTHKMDHGFPSLRYNNRSKIPAGLGFLLQRGADPLSGQAAVFHHGSLLQQAPLLQLVKNLGEIAP